MYGVPHESTWLSPPHWPSRRVSLETRHGPARERAEIRRIFYAEHWPVGTIAAQLGVHRAAHRHGGDQSRHGAHPRRPVPRDGARSVSAVRPRHAGAVPAAAGDAPARDATPARLSTGPRCRCAAPCGTCGRHRRRRRTCGCRPSRARRRKWTGGASGASASGAGSGRSRASSSCSATRARSAPCSRSTRHWRAFCADTSRPSTPWAAVRGRWCTPGARARRPGAQTRARGRREN